MMRLIRKGNVRVNGKRCKPNHHLQAGDEVFVPVSLRQNDTIEREKDEMPAFLLRQVE